MCNKQISFTIIVTIVLKNFTTTSTNIPKYYHIKICAFCAIDSH